MENKPALNGTLFKELETVIAEKKNQRDPLIEVLHAAQQIFGYLPPEVQKFVSEKLDIPMAQVYGVVTFYNYFSMKPRGENIINVCTGTACYVKGAPRLIQMLKEELGIEMGETTEDNQFTLTSVRCVGACSLAPVVVIGEETYGRVDSRKKLKKIIDSYRK